MTELNALAQQINEYFERMEQAVWNHLCDIIDDNQNFDELDLEEIIRPLQEPEFTTLMNLVNEAVDRAPEEPLFLFWRGLGYQLLSGSRSLYDIHPHFEYIEDSYERILKRDPRNEAARLMLTYLHWDHARRLMVKEIRDPLIAGASEKVRMLAALFDSPSEEVKTKAMQEVRDIIDGIIVTVEEEAKNRLPHVDYRMARKIWTDFREFGGYAIEPCSTEFGRYYYLSPGLWWAVFHRIAADVIPREHLSEEYHWRAVSLDGWSGVRILSRESYRQVLKYAPDSVDPVLMEGHAVTHLMSPVEDKEPDLTPEQALSIMHKMFGAFRSMDVDTRRRMLWMDMPYSDLHDGDLLTAFFETYASFCTERPEECVRLVEYGIESGLLDFDEMVLHHEFPSKSYTIGLLNLAVILARLYMGLERYEDALYYLETVYREYKLDDDAAIDLVLVYAMLGRATDAFPVLSRIESRNDGRTRWLLPLLHSFAMTQQRAETAEQRAADAANFQAFAEQLLGGQKEIERQVRDMRDMVAAHFVELQTRFADLSLAKPATVSDDAWATQFSAQVAAQVAATLDRSSHLYDQAREECASSWPQDWIHFPNELQDLITDAEVLHQAWRRQKNPNFVPVVLLWGKVAEIGFKLAFIEPLADYLDSKSIKAVVAMIQTKRVSVDLPEKTQWSDYLPNQVQLAQLVGLLSAAAAHEKHPVREFLDAQKYDGVIWSGFVPRVMKEIVDARNVAAHTAKRLMGRDADEVRAALYTEGLLKTFGEVFSAKRSRRAGRARPGGRIAR